MQNLKKADKEAAKRKASEVITMPTQKFDSLQAKSMLALGKGTIVGEAFTRQKRIRNEGPRKSKS